MAATIIAETGERSEALRLLHAVLATPVRGPNYDSWAGPATRVAIAIGDVDLADALLAGLDGTSRAAVLGRRWSTAMIAEARGEHERATPDYLAAAAEWKALDAPFECASAYLGAARCLVALGRPAEAGAPLADARSAFERLGAAPSLALVDALEQMMTASSSASARGVPGEGIG